MTKRGIPMHQLREILRLHYEVGLKDREIARSQGISHATAGDIVKRFERAGLTWPLADDPSDTVLHHRLYPGNAGRPRTRPEPDWAQVHQELRHKGVTLELLWREYRATYPTGYEYSQFCARYRQYQGRVDLVMRKHHRPGEHCYIDYAGPTVPIHDPKTGAVQQAQVFVAVLGWGIATTRSPPCIHNKPPPGGFGAKWMPLRILAVSRRLSCPTTPNPWSPKRNALM